MTRICPICGKPYTIGMMFVGDQTKCRDCRAEQERRMRDPTEEETAEYERRRKEYWQ